VGLDRINLMMCYLWGVTRGGPSIRDPECYRGVQSERVKGDQRRGLLWCERAKGLWQAASGEEPLLRLILLENTPRKQGRTYRAHIPSGGGGKSRLYISTFEKDSKAFLPRWKKSVSFLNLLCERETKRKGHQENKNRPLRRRSRVSI